MTVKIVSLQVENVKRVKAAHLEPAESGVTIIGGKNGQGKTSILDAIAWALGGGKREPSKAQREGAPTTPEIFITLSNGLTVERSGKNGALKVTDPSGVRGGQTLLDSFVSQFALDVTKFMEAKPQEKAQMLIRSLGIGDQLTALDKEEKALFDERTVVGRVAKDKVAHAALMPQHNDAPTEPVQVADLVQQHKAACATNEENRRARARLVDLTQQQAHVEREIRDAEERLAGLRARNDALNADVAAASKTVEKLQDVPTEDIEAQIAGAETINAQVAANRQKQAAIAEAREYQAKHTALDSAIDAVRKARTALLEGASMPLPGLTVEAGDVLYNGAAWDCMSGSEQLRVAVAIARGDNPACGFVLLNDLERMDLDTLREFSEWAVSEGLQIIATRVSTGGECTIIIEDGTSRDVRIADLEQQMDFASDAIIGEDT